MHISLPEFDDTTVFEFWNKIITPPHPLALFHFQPPQPRRWPPPLPSTIQYKFCNLLMTLTDCMEECCAWSQHKHPTPPLPVARTSGFSLCNICASMQDLPQILDHGFGQTFMAHHEIFYSYRQILFWPQTTLHKKGVGVLDFFDKRHCHAPPPNPQSEGVRD
jgi:hypothetical protein